MIVNGDFVEELVIPSNSPLLFGDGLTESLRTYDGAAFGIERHLERLFQSASELLYARVETDSIRKGVKELLLREPHSPYGRLKIVSLSDGFWFATHDSFTPLLDPVSLSWSPFARASQGYLLGKKSLSYGETRSAIRAQGSSEIADVVYLNGNEEVIETGFGNIAILRGGEWITPPLALGCLPGVTRAYLLENFGFREGVIARQDLERADEVIVTSAVRKITPVHAIGEMQFSYSRGEALRDSFESWILGTLSR